MTGVPVSMQRTLHNARVAARLSTLAPLLCAVAASAGASVLVTPQSVTVQQGQASGLISVTITFVSTPNLSSGVVQVTGLPAGVATDPPTPTYTVATPRTQFRLWVGPNVNPGTYSLTVRDASNGAGSAALVLVVNSAPPPTPSTPTPTPTPTPFAVPLAISAVVPSVVSAGTLAIPVRLIGTGFDPGARVEIQAAGVELQGARILSATLAEIVVSVRADAASGPRTLRLVAPNGRAGQAALVVLPSSSLAGSATVAAAVVVYPQPGAVVGASDRPTPKGVLATAGTGTITGRWRLDGVPFDSFFVAASGGAPVEVSAHVPLPPLLAGEHRLELAIDSPQSIVSEPVILIGGIATDSTLRLLAPGDGARVSAAAGGTTLRWSLVPGAVAYEVELEAAGGARRFRTTESAWRPDPKVWQELGPGSRQWSVRPIFISRTRGPASAPRRLTIVPREVEITHVQVSRDRTLGHVRVTWQGGAPGVVYKVELFDARAEQARFSALTWTQSYLFPRHARYGPTRSSVRVTGLGPAGETLGAADVVESGPRGDAGFVIEHAALAAPQVVSVAPADGAIVDSAQPQIAARWEGSLGKEEAALAIDDTDVTAIAQWTEGAVVCTSAVPLAAGAHTAKLRLGAVEKSWSFTVPAAEEAAAAASDAGPGATATPARRNWFVAAQTTQTEWQDLEPSAVGAATDPGMALLPPGDSLRAQVSSQLDFTEGAFSLAGTGDLAARQDLADPRKRVRENRNWLLHGGIGQGAWRMGVKGGYFSPDLSDQAEILTAGLMRSGVQARFDASMLSASFYQSTGGDIGLLSGLGPQPRLMGGSLQIARNATGSMLRGILIEADRPAGELADASRTRLTGVLGRLVLGQGFSLLAEGARSITRPRATPEYDTVGSSWRVGLMASNSALSGAVNVRRFGAGFSNPLNAGLVTSAASDLLSVDGQFTGLFHQGRGSLALQLRHIESPLLPADDAPSLREEGAVATLALGMGRPLGVILAANTTIRSGDAYEAWSMPKTDRIDVGGSATLTQQVRTFSFSQMGSWQQARDRQNPLADSTTMSGMLTSTGSVGSTLSASAMLMATRTAADPAMGNTDSLTASFQLTLNFARLKLSLQPNGSYSWTANKLIENETTMEHYGGLVSWKPGWKQLIVGLQAVASWDRMRMLGFADAGFQPRLAGAISLRWGTGRGALAETPDLLPPPPMVPVTVAPAVAANRPAAMPYPR